MSCPPNGLPARLKHGSARASGQPGPVTCRVGSCSCRTKSCGPRASPFTTGQIFRTNHWIPFWRTASSRSGTEGSPARDRCWPAQGLCPTTYGGRIRTGCTRSWFLCNPGCCFEPFRPELLGVVPVHGVPGNRPRIDEHGRSLWNVVAHDLARLPGLARKERKWRVQPHGLLDHQPQVAELCPSDVVLCESGLPFEGLSHLGLHLGHGSR
jgi:hypothetical protein